MDRPAPYPDPTPGRIGARDDRPAHRPARAARLLRLDRHPPAHRARPGLPVPGHPRRPRSPVARALGLDPRPGTVTEHPTGDARIELRGGHWAALAVGPLDHPATLAERPVTAEWEAAARAGGHVALVLSYRPLPDAADIEAHADRSMATGRLVLGLLPALDVA